jgi:hypothetical protein
MAMRRIAALGSTVVLCAWAAPGAAAASRAVTPPPARTVVVIREDQGVLGPHAAGGFLHACPARAPHPIGGTFGPPDGSPLAGQFLLAGSYRVGRTGWRVRLQNITGDPQPFFAGTVCVGADVSFAYPRASGVAAPGMDSGANVPCPRAEPRAVGGWFRPQSPSGVGQIAGDSAFRTREGWDLGVRNIGPMPQAYFAGAVCAGAALRTAMVSRVRTLPAGLAVHTALRCPAREPQPVTAVFAAADTAAAGQIVATDAFRTGAARWTTGIRNLSSSPQRGAAGVLCVR